MTLISREKVVVTVLVVFPYSIKPLVHTSWLHRLICSVNVYQPFQIHLQLQPVHITMSLNDFKGEKSNPDGSVTLEYQDWCRTVQLREELRRIREQQAEMKARTEALNRAGEKYLQEQRDREQRERRGQN